MKPTSCKNAQMSETNHSALLVIDVQEAVIEDAWDMEGFLGRLNALIEQARETGTPIIFIQHEEVGEEALSPGSSGWQLASDLDFRPGDLLVHKKYRDGFADTELDDLLGDVGAKRLFVTGSQSDYCVQTTATSALAHGYDVALVADAHTTCAAPVRGGVVPGQEVVDFVNNHFATMHYPGRRVEVVSAGDVSF